MISSFFIHRPRFAFVISIVITIAGLIAIKALPIAQYPNITPPQVAVSATYPGADAMTVQETVVEPIETQINGVKEMIYMSSTSSDSGTATITVTFGIGTDGDMNTVNVQNRVNWASARLPDEVSRQGVVVKERSNNMLLVLSLYSPDGTYDSLWLNNYVSLNIKEEIARIPGVGDVQLLGGADYAMRIWVNPDRMASLNMTVDEIISAVRAQNVQVSAGAIGDTPTGNAQLFRYAVQTQGRLPDVEAFEEIVVRSLPDGQQVKIKDIANVELGAENYFSSGHFQGKPAALMAIYQLNDANGMRIAAQCRAKLEDLKTRFPEDLAYDFNYDTTEFIQSSIDEVVKTLFEAVFLVVLVTFLFLQDWRSTLVPTIAIPVSLIGTFAVMLAIGYSINLITLFGLILAIGIVVDDAILVIENVSRLMEEEKLPPKEATLKSMQQVTGPIIATTAVLLAMFLPICFMGGITGEMYRQFGITISVAVTISSINALTLSPALSSILLKAPGSAAEKGFLRRLLDKLVFNWFNRFFEKMTHAYSAVVNRIIKRAIMLLVCYALLGLVIVQVYRILPSGFIPDEDQGAFFVNVQLPDAAALPRTQAVIDKVTKAIDGMPGIRSVSSNTGYSILTGTTASNTGFLICSLTPWEERKSKELSQNAILAAIRAKVSDFPEAVIMPFTPPAIPGIGSTGGFSFVIQDTSGTNPGEMSIELNKLIQAANRNPAIAGAFSTFRASVPQVYLEINREKALKMGVPLTSINQALQSLIGFSYINDFNRFGKVYKVEIQAKTDYRSTVDNLANLHVRNNSGDMIPLSTMVSVSERFVPQYLNRYNMYSSATINGSPAPGYSSGQAMAAMEEEASKILPPNMTFDWTDMSYQERLAGGQLGVIMAIALLFMYLFLVAQYESWMVPIAVLLSVPVAFFGALVSLLALNLTNNIYTQVGFILLFGVACKTAILIVEFAKVQHEDEGMGIVDAAMFAAKLRFRAVLMTGVSFLLGLLPLVVATGAGAASRRSLGTAICGGMLAAVVIGTFLIPGFYVIIQKITEFTTRGRKNKA
jgi:HAE1 family hydrophobic/amphiphilic exporter-1